MTTKFIAHTTDTVEIGGRVLYTDHWVMRTDPEIDGLTKHRTFYGQFFDLALHCVDQGLTEAQWGLLDAAIRVGDVHMNGAGVPMDTWDRIAERVKPMCVRLYTQLKHAQVPPGVVVWALSSGVCIAKETARQLIERGMRP